MSEDKVVIHWFKGNKWKKGTDRNFANQPKLTVDNNDEGEKSSKNSA